MRRPKFLEDEFQRTMLSVGIGLIVLAILLVVLSGCFGHYQYSVDRAIDPPKNGEFGSSADIRKYCDEQKNETLCQEALTRGRLQEKSSGWGLLPPGPTVSPYPYDQYLYYMPGYPYSYLGYSAPLFPRCIYYDPQDLVGHPECGWQPQTPITPKVEEKKKEESP